MMEIEKNKKYRLINNRTREIIDVLCYNKYSYPFDDIRYRCVCCSINLQEIIINSENVFYQKDFREKELENYSITSLTEEPNFIEFENIYKLFENAKNIIFIADVKLVHNGPGWTYDRWYICNIFYFRIDNIFTEILFCTQSLEKANEEYYSKAVRDLYYAYIFQSEFRNELSLDLFRKDDDAVCKYYNTHFDFTSLKATLLNQFFKIKE